MKYVKQFLIILVISFLGELCRYYISLLLPASIYGLILMLLALMSGLVKLEQVKDVAVFLIEVMPVMFIPAGAGLLVSWEALQPIVFPVAVITIATTVIVMAVSGRMTQFVIRRGKEGQHE